MTSTHMILLNELVQSRFSNVQVIFIDINTFQLMQILGFLAMLQWYFFSLWEVDPGLGWSGLQQ